MALKIEGLFRRGSEKRIVKEEELNPYRRLWGMSVDFLRAHGQEKGNNGNRIFQTPMSVTFRPPFPVRISTSGNVSEISELMLEELDLSTKKPTVSLVLSKGEDGIIKAAIEGIQNQTVGIDQLKPQKWENKVKIMTRLMS